MRDTLFSGERAFKHLEKLAVEIGPRPSGSREERRAAEYIASEFEDLGLKTSLQEFEVTTGRVVSKRLEVLEPYSEEVACEAIPLMGSTGPEGVAGDLLYLETTDEEYLTPEVSGKVILTGRFNRREIRLLAKLKPLAVITIEASPRTLPKHLWGMPELREKYGAIPSLRVSYEDGLKLLERGARKVRVVVETEEEKVRSQNVVGELEGSQRPEEIVLVGGHYDTVPEVQGAGDNAGGTALVMELARVFKEKGTRRTMRFIAWGCEEMGLRGSIHYARRLREEAERLRKERPEEEVETELDRIKLTINLDVHGAFLGTNFARVLGPPELTAAVKLLSKEVGVAFEVKEGVYSSDGTSLSSVGVPSVSFGRGGGSNVFMHSVEDTIRWLKPQALQVQGEFVERFLTRYVAQAAAFPFEKKIPEKQRKEIEDYFRKRLMLRPP